MSTIVDARGLACPQPVIKTHAALQDHDAVTTIVIPVMAEDETDMWINRISVAWTGRSSTGTDWLVGAVHIRDANQSAVSGATVAVVWTLPDGTVLGQTAITADVTGIAKFGVWAGRGVYTLCVQEVTKDGWLYNPALSVQTCGVLTSATR